MTAAVITIEGLTVEVPGRGPILGPLSLAIEQGEHVLVVGPSGSGKSTLLRCVAGLQPPTAGTIALFGRPASGPGQVLLSPEKRGVGMLFQRGALWPHMSVSRTLKFVLARRGVARKDRPRRVSELLEKVDLSGFEARKPGTLSGGEAQRLAMARALAAEAKILLLDEPLGALDPKRRTDLLQRLQELHQSDDLTILHVTHAPDEAAGVATRILALDAGVLV